MRALILAAGRGSRMGNKTDDKPKCMVSLQGKPLIEWQKLAITNAGITSIAIVTGYMAEKINLSKIEKTFVNLRWNKSNMVRSLLCAKSWLEKDTCIVSYGDLFYETNAISTLWKVDADIAITYDINFKNLWSARSNNPLSDLETFKLNDLNFLTEIGSQANSFDQVDGQYMGLLKFTTTGWTLINQLLRSMSSTEIDTLDMTSMLQKAIHAGIKVKAIAYSGQWGEIDNQGDLALYESWRIDDYQITPS